MENYMWHVALEPGTTKMQDVIIAKLAIDDFDTISFLLSSNDLRGRVFEEERGGYGLVYGGEYKKPYPSVIVWRFRNTEDGSIVENMQPGDAWVLEEIWRWWLMPEETDAEYVPPKQFLVMERNINEELNV